ERALLRPGRAGLGVADDQLLGGVRLTLQDRYHRGLVERRLRRLDVDADRLQEKQDFFAADPHLGGQLFDSDLSHAVRSTPSRRWFRALRWLLLLRALRPLPFRFPRRRPRDSPPSREPIRGASRRTSRRSPGPARAPRPTCRADR